MTVGGIGSGWQDAAFYRALLQCGRAGLAWEVLRRNPEYRKEIIHAPQQLRCQQVGPTLLKGAESGIAARWGLHFRRRSRHQSTPCPADLVGQV
tara:strand:- start:5676 stop:5957 length:282 start_codon:yes stop_codon:yes gene_type:complete